MFERWYLVSPTTTRPTPSVLASQEHPKVLHALHERSVAFAKYPLAACIKGALDLQGFPVGPPLPLQQPLGSAGRQKVREVSNVLQRSVGSSNPMDHEDRDRGVRACRL
jgi:hypothetical protein